MKGAQALRRKIESAEQLHSVVRTMKALAAANIRDCDRAVQALAEYTRAMELGFQSLLRRRPGFLTLHGVKTANRLGMVIFGSDQGMCGQLNAAVVNSATELLNAREQAPGFPRIRVVGDRAAALLDRAGGYDVEHVQSSPQSLVTIATSVRETLLALERWRADVRANEIVLVHAKRGSGTSFHPIRVRLLPVDREWVEELKSRPWSSRSEPLVGLPIKKMFRSLLRQHLYIALYRAFAESLASENASRLASMEGAERNIEERLDELDRAYRSTRQTAITEELLDIVSGFEALAQDSNSQ